MQHSVERKESFSELLAEVRAKRTRAEQDRQRKREAHWTPKPGGRAERKRMRKEKEREDAAFARLLARKRTQRRYYEKNKDRLNRNRTLRARMPQEVYRKTKARAQARGQEWLFSYTDWLWVWENAPRVWNPFKGFYDSAWNMKGGNYNVNTQMYRRDLDKPWSVDNCYIGLNGKELEDPEDVRDRHRG